MGPGGASAEGSLAGSAQREATEQEAGPAAEVSGAVAALDGPPATDEALTGFAWTGADEAQVDLDAEGGR
jgi:hypothetical protein